MRSGCQTPDVFIDIEIGLERARPIIGVQRIASWTKIPGEA